MHNGKETRIPVHIAKRRLANWRRTGIGRPTYESDDLTDTEKVAVTSIMSGKLLPWSHMVISCLRKDADNQIASWLLEVLEHDHWYNDTFGKQWIVSWMKWGSPWSDEFPESSEMLGKIPSSGIR